MTFIRNCNPMTIKIVFYLHNTHSVYFSVFLDAVFCLLVCLFYVTSKMLSFIVVFTKLRTAHVLPNTCTGNIYQFVCVVLKCFPVQNLIIKQTCKNKKPRRLIDFCKLNQIGPIKSILFINGKLTISAIYKVS